MAIRRIPTPSTLKSNPNKLATINRNDPLSRGLVFCCYPVGNGFYDLISGQFVSAPATQTLNILQTIDGNSSATIYGKNSAVLTFAKQTGLDLISGACTLFAEAAEGASGVSGNILSSFSAGNGYGMQFRFDDGSTAYDSFNLYTGNTVNTSGFNPAPNRALVGGVATNDITYKYAKRFSITLDATGNLKWYANRKLKQTSAWGVNRLPAASVSRVTAICNNANHKIGLLLAYDRVLSDEENFALYDNPWRVLKAPAKTFKLSVPGGGLTTVFATTAVGTVSPNVSRSIAGNLATSNAGNVAATSPNGAGLLGGSAIAAVGTVSSSVATTLTGNSSSGSVGNLSSTTAAGLRGNFSGTNNTLVLSYGAANPTTYFEPADGVASATVTGVGQSVMNSIIVTDGTNTTLRQQGFDVTTGTFGAGANGFAQGCSICSASTSIGSISGTTLTITTAGGATGYLLVGQTILGIGIATGTVITALGTGAGGVGTYTVNNSQTVASTTIKASKKSGVDYPGQYWLSTGKGLAGEAGIFSDAINAYLDYGSSKTIITKVDGTAFNMLSIDLAPIPSFLPAGGGGATIGYTSFTGYQGVTAVVTQTVIQDFSTPKFTTFALTGFANLTSVVIQDAGKVNGNLVGGSASNSPFYMHDYIVLQPTSAPLTSSSALGVSGVTTLTSVGAAGLLPMSASFVSVAIVTASLTNGINLAATPTAIVSTTASLTATPASLSANCINAASSTAALTNGINLASAPTAVASSSAALTSSINLASAPTTVSTTSAALTSSINFASAPTAISSASAALLTVITLAANPVGAASANAALSTSISLSSASSASATVNASLSAGAGLFSSAAATAMATASITTSIVLAANPASVATSTAAITSAINLIASPVSAASASAALVTGISLIASPASIVTTTAALTAGNSGVSANAVSSASTTAALTSGIALATSGSAVATASGSMTTSITLFANNNAASIVTATLTTGTLSGLVASSISSASAAASLTTAIVLSSSIYSITSATASLPTLTTDPMSLLTYPLAGISQHYPLGA